MQADSGKIHVLLVDDSSFMRIVLQDILNAYPEIQVTDTATNGLEAVEKCQVFKPDVVLLDLIMENYDGLYALKEIMNKCPTPVVILSSIRNTDPSAVIEALNAGAVDFIDKPTGLGNAKIRDIGEQIVRKLKVAAGSRGQVRALDKTHKNQYAHTFDANTHYKAVVIGASTGGTGALEYILLHLPANFPLPIIIAQHMPPEFIHSFATRLDQMSPLHVKVAQESEEIMAGRVYFLPGDKNTKLVQKSTQGKIRFACTDQVFTEYNNPSVDCLFESAAEIFQDRLVMILLTGMGKDGAQGLLKGYKKGALTITQHPDSCVVYGMPKAAVELGASKYSVQLQDIASFVVSAVA